MDVEDTLPVEPPQDVMVPYSNPVVGYVAFGIVRALIASVVVGSVYGVVLWNRHTSRTETPETVP